MAFCEDEDCEDESPRRVLCFHCGLYVCGWCWHHVHGCEPGHKKAECRDYKRFLQYGKEWIRRLRTRLTINQAFETLKRSFKVRPCPTCEGRLFGFPVRELSSRTPESTSVCKACNLSFQHRYQEVRKQDIASIAAS